MREVCIFVPVYPGVCGVWICAGLHTRTCLRACAAPGLSASHYHIGRSAHQSTITTHFGKQTGFRNIGPYLKYRFSACRLFLSQSRSVLASIQLSRPMHMESWIFIIVLGINVKQNACNVCSVAAIDRTCSGLCSSNACCVHTFVSSRMCMHMSCLHLHARFLVCR